MTDFLSRKTQTSPDPQTPTTTTSTSSPPSTLLPGQGQTTTITKLITITTTTPLTELLLNDITSHLTNHFHIDLDTASIPSITVIDAQKQLLIGDQNSSCKGSTKTTTKLTIPLRSPAKVSPMCVQGLNEPGHVPLFIELTIRLPGIRYPSKIHIAPTHDNTEPFRHLMCVTRFNAKYNQESQLTHLKSWIDSHTPPQLRHLLGHIFFSIIHLPDIIKQAHNPTKPSFHAVINVTLQTEDLTHTIKLREALLPHPNSPTTIKTGPYYLTASLYMRAGHSLPPYNSSTTQYTSINVDQASFPMSLVDLATRIKDDPILNIMIIAIDWVTPGITNLHTPNQTSPQVRVHITEPLPPKIQKRLQEVNASITDFLETALSLLIPESPPVAFFRQDQLYTDPIPTTTRLHHTSPMPMLPPSPISATVAIPTHLPSMLSALTPPSYQHHDIQALIAATIQTEMTNQLQVALGPITTRLDQVEASAKTLREELQESLRSGNETNAQMRNFMQQMSLMMGAQQSDRSSPPSTGGQQNR
jgi:hypothetical protein